MAITMRVREVGRPGTGAPLLVVLDGPEYVRRAQLLPILRRLVTARQAPAHRVVLVSPDDRLETYSASTPYARALVAALDDLAGKRPRRVGLGASLGALALLHAHRVEPRAFAGLFLQSGSYFRRRTDAQESRFPRFSRIDRFVGTVLNAKDGARPVPTTITCGLDEENYGNNAAVAQALAAQGYGVDFHAARGGHDWPSWRRALDAHLAPLLRRAWR
ncbi:MAG: putative esterase [Acidobacteria bacterium]|nr:putative esterase [Acidobacteriota bacterium]